MCQGEKSLVSDRIFRQIVIEEDEAGSRIDSFLTTQAEIPSRSFAQKLIAKGLVAVSAARVNKHYRVRTGDKVVFEIPPAEEARPEPEPLPVDTIYEDEDLIVVSKPAGMVVHPCHGHSSGTLVNALLAHTKDLSGIGGIKRPGIVHRLDKDVSGIMMVAKNDVAHIELSRQLREREVKRTYLAMVHGLPPADMGTIEASLGRSPKDRKRIAVVEGGRPAVTRFKVRERLGDLTLLEVDLETGRTHQIRVHLSFIGHPLVGDRVYGRRRERKEIGLKRPFLHAFRLQFHHPRSKKRLVFTDELPAELEEFLTSIRQTTG